MNKTNLNCYRTRALEVHDFARIWDLKEMRRRLKFMVANDLNTLVLHEPGIVDKVVFPAKFLGGKSEGTNFFEISQELDEAIARVAMREFQNAFRQTYLSSLIAEAAESEIQVFLEDKELWFKDFILIDHPELFHNGVFCPSKPFWWEQFLPEKYKELFIALPKLAGVITSFGTGESRLALSNMYQCGCEDCKALDPTEWHRKMALGIFKPFHEAGKKLVIRDFIFQREEHQKFAKALERIPLEIVLSLKNTPHDFYPTFPDNPLIGKVGSREQWIEYDVHGQYFGWGEAPSIMIDDLSHRLRHGSSNGVTGFILRTDWEGIQSHSCFDTANLINLYAATSLVADQNVEKREIYRRWLTEEKLVEDPAIPGVMARCVEWAMDLLEQSWPTVRATMFVNNTVFSDSGTFHVNLKQSTWIAETLHSLKDWTDSADDALAMQEKNVRQILDEKERAVAMATELHAKAAAHNPGLTAPAYNDLVRRFDFLRVFAQGFLLTGRIYVFAKQLENQDIPTTPFSIQDPHRSLKNALEDLQQYIESLKHSPYSRMYPANALLDPRRLGCFYDDAMTRLNSYAR